MPLDRRKAADLLYEVGRGAAVAFMVLLVIAAAYLAAGRESTANLLAEYAYYSLVAAVASMLASTILEPEGGTGTGKRVEHPGGGAASSEGGGGGFVVSAGWARGVVKRLARLRPTLLRSRLPVAGRAAYLAGSVLFYFHSAGLLGLGVVPGRPTYTPEVAPHGGLAGFLLYLLASMLSMGSVSLAYIAAALALALLALLPPSPLAGVAGVAAAIVGPMLGLRGLGVLVSSSLAMLAGALVAVYGYLAHSLALEAYGWAVLLLGTLAGFVVGFASSLALLPVGRGHAVRGEAGGEEGGAGGGGGVVWGVLLLSAGVALAVASALLPRAWRPGVYSLDTMYNLRFCHRLYSGDYSVFATWRRPLYVLLATLPASLAGCPYQFYDILLETLGLALLAATVFLLVLREGWGWLWAGYTALLSAAFWAPFFTYAGLQTNLLTLPLALLALRESLEGRLGGRRRIAVAILWLVVGLMHPWTLAFYTAALAASTVAAYGFNVRRVAGRLALTAAGWAGYGAVELAARGFTVGEVARSVFAARFNYLETLKIYFWGTSIRGELILPAALALALMALGILRLPRRSMWLLGPTIVAFLLAPAPNARLIPRYLVDSTVPLVAALALREALAEMGERAGWLPAALTGAASVTAALLYLAHTAPVAPPPR